MVRITRTNGEIVDMTIAEYSTLYGGAVVVQQPQQQQQQQSVNQKPVKKQAAARVVSKALRKPSPGGAFKPYSRDELRQVREFCEDLDNYRDYGVLKGDNVRALAAKLGRSDYSVNSCISTRKYALSRNRVKHLKSAVAQQKGVKKQQQKIYGTRRYTPEQLQRIIDFYKDPANRWIDGTVITEELQKLANELGTTPDSLRSFVAAKKLRPVIYGSKEKQYPNAVTQMLEPAVPGKVYPEPKQERQEHIEAQAEQHARRLEHDQAVMTADRINSALQFAVANGTLTQISAIALGLDLEQFDALCDYVLRNNQAIEQKFGKALRVVRQGQETVIRAQ